MRAGPTVVGRNERLYALQALPQRLISMKPDGSDRRLVIKGLGGRRMA